MKMTRIAMLSLAVVLYATSALAQHGHSGAGAAGGAMGGTMGGGTGSNAGSSMGHGSTASDHGSAGGVNSGSSASAHQATIDGILAKNPAIGDKIQSLTGEPASQACTGFKNLGQCVAAAHVSKNLGISFACLSSDMTGQAPAQGTTCPAGTGTKSMSLGKAIQTLSPTADFKAQGKKGETQAQQDLKRSGVKA
jgi:hypothetical protein